MSTSTVKIFNPALPRSTEMSLMHEALARAHCHDLQRQAEAERAALALLRAKRLRRRAERAEYRARQARRAATAAATMIT